MKKSIIILTSILVTAVLFSACTKKDESEVPTTSDGKRILNVNSDWADPAPKATMDWIVEEFEKENPDIDVQLNVFDKEAYKSNIRNFLASEPPDVATWYAGNRMKFFVDQGLFEDVSDMWAEYDLTNKLTSTMSAMTVEGKQYGVPITYYQWGVYYRKDIFDRLGLSEPQTWDEFLSVGETLLQNNITPFSIGTKFLWTAAGWFDYLNLRINGFDYHIKLTDGDIPFTDPGLDEVFDKWAELINNGYYIENHATYSWQEAQTPFLKGDAAMYLIGNFIVPFFNEAGIEDQFDFFPFPVINSEIPSAEDAPIDTAHIPSKAKNKEDAKKFLAFLVDNRISQTVNERITQLSPNNQTPPPTDRFLSEGFALLSSADGIAQFYDRDTSPAMAKIAMEGFQEFMVNPSRVDAIRERLTKAQENN